MARSKDEAAEWEKYHDELKSLWLDKRWTLKRLQEYMSQTHNFCKSEKQFTRQFNRWGFKKNSKEVEWHYVARRVEKRKRDGKGFGPVQMHGKLIPEPKVMKEISRHCKLSNQYFGDLDPPTPDGVMVGTPRADIASISDAPMNGLQNGSSDILGLEDLAPAPLLDGDLALQFDMPELTPSDFDLHSQWIEQPAVFADPSHLLMEHQAMAPGLSSPAVAENDATSHNSDHKMTEETLQILLRQFDARGGREHGDLITALEPVTTGTDTQFQSTAPKNLSNYLQMCVYLAANNLLAEASTRQLVSLIAKTNSHSRLKALVSSNSTSNEIFMSTLLGSAAAKGDAKICQVLIEAGADLDALSGMTTRTTPLHRAIKGMNLQCVKLLLDAGADSNLVVEKNTPLHNACAHPFLQPSLDIVKHLLQRGAHVNPTQDCSRLTPLQLVAEADEPEVLKLLLKNGADPNVFTTSKSGTALQMACNFSDNSMMAELLYDAGADIDSFSAYRISSSGNSDTESCSSEDLDDWSIEGGLPNSCKSPILIAASRENWETVQVLVDEGAAINTELKRCPPPSPGARARRSRDSRFHSTSSCSSSRE